MVSTTDVESSLPPVHIVDSDEAREIFEYQARSLMNMSGDEFIRRWDAGEFDAIADAPGHRHIMRLALMIPLVRSNS